MRWYFIASVALLAAALWLVDAMTETNIEICAKNNSRPYCENTLGL